MELFYATNRNHEGADRWNPTGYHKKNISLITVMSMSVFALLILTGCPRATPQPFIHCSDSAIELRKGADAALTVNDEANKERFIVQTAAASLTPEGAGAINNLMLTTDPKDPFAWHMEKPPLFMQSQKFRAGVYTLNTALVNYAELVKELSSPELVSTERFDTLTNDLNANLGLAAKSLGINDAGQDLALFSLTATEILKSYLENRKTDVLRKALKENSKNIQGISDRMQHAVRLVAANLNQNYSDESGKLIENIADPRSKDLKKKTELVKTQVELNQTYIHRLAVLQVLHESYAALPRVNSDMINLIENPKFDASTIKELFENGKHLLALHDELVKTVKASNNAKEGEK